MPEMTRTLRVYPNPYLQFDAVGRPCSAFPRQPHPQNMDTAVHHVGARRVTGRMLRDGAVHEPGKTVPWGTVHHEYVFHYGDQPEEADGKAVDWPAHAKALAEKGERVTDKSRGPGQPTILMIEDHDPHYYTKAILRREIIAADKETWVLAGGKPEQFQDPMLALCDARAGLQAQHVAHYGAPSPHIDAHWADLHAATAKKHGRSATSAPSAPTVSSLPARSGGPLPPDNAPPVTAASTKEGK